MLIAVAAVVYLNAANPLAGAVLFAFALLFICLYQLNLYTGKIGYLLVLPDKKFLIEIWLGNLLGACLAGGLWFLANPAFVENSQALTMFAAKDISWYLLLVKGFFCGILMFLAVDNWKKHPDMLGALGIVFCISVFISCGFEHSIADMAYWALAGFPLFGLRIILLVTIGNSLGSLFIKWLLDPSKRHRSGTIH